MANPRRQWWANVCHSESRVAMVFPEWPNSEVRMALVGTLRHHGSCLAHGNEYESALIMWGHHGSCLAHGKLQVVVVSPWWLWWNPIYLFRAVCSHRESIMVLESDSGDGKVRVAVVSLGQSWWADGSRREPRVGMVNPKLPWWGQGDHVEHMVAMACTKWLSRAQSSHGVPRFSVESPEWPLSSHAGGGQYLAKPVFHIHAWSDTCKGFKAWELSKPRNYWHEWTKLSLKTNRYLEIYICLL